MSWKNDLRRLVSAFGASPSSMAAIPSPEQKILRTLSRRALTARELASECKLSLDEVYSVLGSLYDRRAVATHPSGYFWVGKIDLPLDRIFQERRFRDHGKDLRLAEAPVLSA